MSSVSSKPSLFQILLFTFLCGYFQKIMSQQKRKASHHRIKPYFCSKPKQNFLAIWRKVLSFHWTTLMQDALDIPGAGCECHFTWLFTLESGYSILVQWKDTIQVFNRGEEEQHSTVKISKISSVSANIQSAATIRLFNHGLSWKVLMNRHNWIWSLCMLKDA